MGLAALTSGIRATPLVDWDEATYAEVAHEAIASGSYLDLTWNGQPYLKKPPLLFWGVIGSFKLFGESEWAARLSGVAAGIGTMILLYLAVVGVGGRIGATFAGIFPLGFYFFIVRGGRECATDGPLIFFSTLAIFALTKARTNRRWLPVIGVACGLAILSKGLAGLVPLMVTVLAIGLIPGFGTLGVSGLLLTGALTALVVAPWLIAETIFHGRLFWSTFVTQETVLRVVSHLEADPQSKGAWGTFVSEVRFLWVLILPLVGLAIAGISGGGQALLRRLSPTVLVWMTWLALALGAACVVQTKLGWYVLPALIPMAALGGTILGAAFGAMGRNRQICHALAAAAVAILVIEAPARWARHERAFQTQRERSRPAYVLGLSARERGASRANPELYFAGVELPTLVYYSQMPCHFITPSAAGFGMVDPGGAVIEVQLHEAVIADRYGATSTIGNLDQEWNYSGPRDERGPTFGVPDPVVR